MISLSAKLAEAAGKNHQLLATLSETDYSVASLTQNKAYLSDLQSQLATIDKQLEKLHASTENERKEHVKYRDSTVKRLAYRLGGSKGKDKFSAKEEKEEREFLDAWQKERESEEIRDEIRNALSSAESENSRLEQENARHDQAQRELDGLYDAIFSGPTPEYPVEDQVEENVRQTKAWLDQSQTQVGNEQRAFDALSNADKMFQRASSDMQSALSHSRYDMWGGGTFNDMIKRDRLSSAQMNISHAMRHLDEAIRCQPAIQPPADVNINTNHMLSDVFFDNIFTDMAMHDRIKDSNAQLENAALALEKEINQQKQRVVGARGQVSQVSSDLENARKELQRVRAEAFERLAGQADVPPPY
ncbi:Hypothetical protein R9X50_00093200 [Acrodontium crateriforme]|uniref:Uncharacterized protein n=1 Tax=Acrodontium crateriforme TaxID=150365 RepID=A0AAQ3LZ46_9PEZI|nr:Hypothetical protein R9X50_00093200 [Acrodontium crateriforme]